MTRARFSWFALLALLLQTSAQAGPPPASRQPLRLALVGRYVSGLGEGLEIVSVQQGSARAVVTLGVQGAIDVLRLDAPPHPQRLARHLLPDAAGRLTCVAFHPTENWYAAVVQSEDAFASGRLLAVDATTGEVLASWPTGVGPDHVTFDASGRVALVACEGEAVRASASEQGWDSPPGSLTLLRCSQGPLTAQAIQIALPDATGTPGVTDGAQKRLLSRTPQPQASDASREAAPHEVQVALVAATPPWLEPEFSAFAPDGRLAYVTLQESNAVAVVDVQGARVVRYIGLGTTQHVADLQADGAVSFRDTLRALREPDGIAVTPNGAVWVTADEGDTAPRFDKTAAGLPGGGGRTLSLFSAHTGRFLGDTGNGLDAAAARAGLYDDARSPQRGSEPENLITFLFDGEPYAAVGLERANALALVALGGPHAPQVLGAWSVGPGGIGPEGVALLRRGALLYVLCANEVSGDLSVFRIER